MPDEFLFTQLASIDQLVIAIKHGTLTAEQKQALEAGVMAGEDGGDGEGHG